MAKLTKYVWSLVLILGLFCVGSLIADMHQLQEGVIRMHIVANSDDEKDQAVKLKVRDAISGYLEKEMQGITNIEQAKVYINSHLDHIRQIADETLRANGSADSVKVSLRRESFDTRHYDTFSLPAGVYESLRVEIGEGAGKNWWCVVFPSLCIPATVDEFQNTAVSSGFSQPITQTVSGGEDYEIRFFLLDCLGRLQNLFHFA